MNYDIIIVGGGLGGLTAGAKLSRAGKKVLLVEQHDRPGGCATTFKRKEFTMEVGLHEMDGMHQRDMKLKVFRDLGILEKVEFLPVPEFYRFVNDRYDIVIPHDRDEAMSVLKSAFPGDHDGIEAYFDDLINARKISAQSAEIPDKSVGTWLDSIIGDEDLKLVLLGNLGYFHDDPYTLSYYYYITAQGAYYHGRANFIKGGSQRLSDALMSEIVNNSGTVLLKTEATKVVLNKDGAEGIEFRTTGKDEKSRVAKAPVIIINSSLPELANRLLPDDYGKNLAGGIKEMSIGASLLTVYFGFNKRLSEIGCENYSTFLYHRSVKSQKDILENNKSDFDTRSFTFVDYGKIDSELAPEGKSVGAVCCIDYLSDWEMLSKEEYKIRKDRAEEEIIERLNLLHPGFAQSVEYCEVGTAQTVKRYTLNPEGAVYGLLQNPGKSTEYLNLLPNNVYVASAWGKFGGGFSGAIFSGYMTAMEILRKK